MECVNWFIKVKKNQVITNKYCHKKKFQVMFKKTHFF